MGKAKNDRDEDSRDVFEKLFDDYVVPVGGAAIGGALGGKVLARVMGSKARLAALQRAEREAWAANPNSDVSRAASRKAWTAEDNRRGGKMVGGASGVLVGGIAADTVNKRRKRRD